ncbi:glycosyl transferase [Novosphingobium album (ex Liu et al. 2023)]|nr:glycosyl transferase [Novosphingobium album (ex Liu et al. 2023)]
MLFTALGAYGLLSPSTLYFDEMHYVPAARLLLDLSPANQEHPLLGKEIFAASIALIGDRPLAWRLPPLLFGGLGLFAFARFIWWTSGRRFATLAAAILLATNLLWFIQSRIAMLDIFAASLLLLALWQFAAAVHPSRVGIRANMACSGILLGLSLGAKWSVAPFLPLPWLAFVILRSKRSHNPPFRSIPQGLSLPEASTWLIIVPLGVYWATFAPALFYEPISARHGLFDIIDLHRRMIVAQTAALTPHPYQSVWFQWVFNLRPVWYLYEYLDGAWRGVLFVGNPFSMLAGLGGLGWCVWSACTLRRADTLALSILYLVGIGFWMGSAKPVQFYYHYLIPAAFLMGCLALALDAAWARNGKWRAFAYAALAVSIGLFAWFYPIISAIPLGEGQGAFEKWMWLDSWR